MPNNHGENCTCRSITRTLPILLIKFSFLLQHTDVIREGHEFSYLSICKVIVIIVIIYLVFQRSTKVDIELVNR